MSLWNVSGGVCRKTTLRRRAPAGLMAGWLLVAAIVMAAGPPSASARVQASIVVDAQTGKVLEAHNADSLCYPASLTKLMTLYITFQQLSAGKMTLSQELPVSSHAAAQAPTKLYLHPGERISVRSAILAITTRSANDAAVVLAEGVAGTELGFANLMNQRARQLGMDHTTFRNASGLPNRRQKTTARDMSKLALAILHDFPQYYPYFKARSFDFRGQTIEGHDHLLEQYPGVDGMKTGYTYASGFNIVTSAVRYDRRLLGVVMGGRTARSRDHLMMALLNRGFARVRVRTATAASPGKVGTGAAAASTAKASDAEGQMESRPESAWIVQIGHNFRSRRQVRSALRSALHTAPDQLKDARPLVVRLRSGRYLARFSEMNEAMAQKACRVLQSRKFTCSARHTLPSSVVMASTER